MPIRDAGRAEDVLCYKADTVCAASGGVLEDLSLWDQVASNLVALPRDDVEGDFAYKQVVVYVVVRSGELLLSYTRPRRSREPRLGARVSIGLGGHVEPQDVAAAALSNKYALLQRAVERELEEEVVIRAPIAGGPDLVGFICDDSDAVGRAHFGALWLVDISRPAVSERRGSGITGLTLTTTADLGRKRPQMEPWSRLVLDWLARGGVVTARQATCRTLNDGGGRD
ncbi:MAG: hypothetical protein PHU43_09830 [Candidatus Bipolaricaulis sp.]|nr:hypothetical protein [Candidatus Bipolaricaulis sp.]